MRQASGNMTSCIYVLVRQLLLLNVPETDTDNSADFANNCKSVLPAKMKAVETN